MGWVLMSERELNRIEVLAQVDDGRLGVQNGANMLDITKRQMFRLLKTYRIEGAAAIRHKARGKTPNNQIHRAKTRLCLGVDQRKVFRFWTDTGGRDARRTSQL